MRKSLCVEQRILSGKVRKHIFRMFICVSGERGEGFTLTHRCEPAAYLRTELLLPALRDKNYLGAPERKYVQKPGNLVAPRLQILHNASQLLDRCGGRNPITLEGSLQSRKLWSRKLLVLQKPKHPGQQFQVICSLFECAGRLLQACMKPVSPG